MPAIDKGAIVEHEFYGRGTVIELRHGGYSAYVSFGRFACPVPVRQLKVVSGGLQIVDGRPKPQKEAKEKPLLERLLEMRELQKKKDSVSPVYRPIKTQAFDWMMDIESLRLGLVPLRHIETWTVGRENEIAQIKRFLIDESEGAMLIEGGYGSGKTHLLTYLAYKGESFGYATMFADIDSSRKSAAFPKRLFNALAKSFRAKVGSKILNLQEFLIECANRDKQNILAKHFAFGPLIEKIRNNTVSQADWNWVYGEDSQSPKPPGMPNLHDFTTCANLYCNMLSGIGVACNNLFGLRGLLVIIDEGEVSQVSEYSYHLRRAMNLFKGLVLTANDDPSLEEKVVKTEECSRGALSRLVYSGHRPIPYFFSASSERQSSYLKVVMGFTPSSSKEVVQGFRASMREIKLGPLPQQAIRDWFKRLCDRFEQVYGVELDEAMRSNVLRILLSRMERPSSSDAIRDFVQSAVTALDLIRFYPDLSLKELLTE